MHRRYVGYHRFYMGFYMRRVVYCNLFACCTGALWDVASSMHDVQALCGLLLTLFELLHPLCGITLEKTGNEDREWRHCVLWWLSPLYKHSAHVSLVNYSGACGSEVRPPLEPTYIIAGNEVRKRIQGTKKGSKDREQEQRTKTRCERC